MSIPLDKLIDNESNVYEMTCVAIKEARIISEVPSIKEEVEKDGGKIVSSVLEKALNNEIVYKKGQE